MRKLVSLVLFFGCSLFVACSDESGSETVSCSLGFDDRTYEPFERVDLRGEDIPEDLTLFSDGLPVVVFVDEIGPYFAAPLSEDGLASLEVRSPDTCSDLQIKVSSVAEPDDGLEQVMSKLRILTSRLPQDIGAPRVLDPTQLGGDVSRAEYAVGVMAQYQAGLDKILPTLTGEQRRILAGMLKKSGVWEIISSAPQTTPTVNALWIPTEFYTINSAAELSQKMTFSAHFCTVARSQGANIASALGAGVAASENIYFKAGATAFSAATFLAFANASLICATHPETLTNLELQNAVELEEDASLWTSGLLTTDAKAGPPANLAVLATGLGFVFKSAGVTLLDSREALKAAEILNGLAADAVVKSLSETIAGKVLEQTTDGASFGGWEWSDIDIAGKEWVTVIPGGNVFVEQPCDTLCLKPLMVGSETVTFVPRLDKFPYSTPELQVVGTVHPITIDIGPAVIPVEPNQDLVFDYRIDWALDPNMEWVERTQLNPEAIIDSTLIKTGFLGYRTPIDPSAYPVAITATSLSIGGLRAPEKSPMPRYDRSLLVLDELVAGPDGTCISPGQSQELFALASSKAGEKATISWEPAALVQDGIFTAPNEPGNYTLTATATYPTQSSISEQVIVNVGDCGCWISVNGSILNARHDFDMTTVWSDAVGAAVVSVTINGQPLTITIPSSTSDMPAGSFLSGVSISADGIWGADAVNTLIAHEADGVHYRGRISGVLMNGEDTGHATIAFRGVRSLNSQACKSRTLYDGTLPSLIKDAATMP